MLLFTGTAFKTSEQQPENALYCQIEQLDLWRERWTGVKDYTSAKRLVEESSVWGEEWVTGGSWPCAGRRSCLAELHSDRGDDPEFGQNVYWQMCFKGVLLSWSWQRKIPCCSAHLQHSTRPRFYLQESWPFKKKWWRSWPCLGFLFFFLVLSVFLSLPPSLSFFHTIEPLSMLSLKANSSPLCTLFHITFKSSAGPAWAPRLLASVQRFASEVTICDA